MKTELLWPDSLFESVYALYEAARDYRQAHRAALLAEAGVDFTRRQIHPGKILLHGRSFDGSLPREPHDLACIYGDHEGEMRRRYQHAALLYATGTAWAIATVQHGGSPARVEFGMGSDGRPVHHRLGTTILAALTEARFAGAPALTAAHDTLIRLVGASEVTERDTSDIFNTAHEARGIGDAAYAYGRLAQSALYFVLAARAQAVTALGVISAP
ncbi:hypothetical protein [Streptomyces sp. NPDC088554]|uniref:hypothetical protein n=1 Tax=Streptomyces sp. NPDC088554 TaxID=3365865 RepID=UPI003815F1EF